MLIFSGVSFQASSLKQSWWRPEGPSKQVAPCLGSTLGEPAVALLPLHFSLWGNHTAALSDYIHSEPMPLHTSGNWYPKFLPKQP